ncbi:MAG: ribokinase [Acetatifactor sp.]|nr:ribokinase [Acetatifactor sp.]MDE7353318.1 ribokinase [Acetatifactor sp.]
MRILNFGSLNLDYVYQVEHFVQPGETLAAREQKMAPGGKGLNQSVALAKAGAEVFHAGCIGIGGEMLQALLEENGVHTEYLCKVDGLQGNAMIQVDSTGENCIILYGGSNRMITKEQIDETLEHFSAEDWMVLQNEVSNLEYMIDKAAKKGMKVVLNPSPFEAFLEKLDYNQISWLLVNEVEARQLTGKTKADAVWNILHEKYPGLCLIMTMGADGAYCFTSQESIYQEAFPVETVDTTAAGDTFTGYFLQGMTKGLPLKECMEQAAKASAICVSREGAAGAIPTKAEVKNLSSREELDDVTRTDAE